MGFESNSNKTLDWADSTTHAGGPRGPRFAPILARRSRLLSLAAYRIIRRSNALARQSWRSPKEVRNLNHPGEEMNAR